MEFNAEKTRIEAKNYVLKEYGDVMFEQKSVDDYYRGAFAQFQRDKEQNEYLLGLVERLRNNIRKLGAQAGHFDDVRRPTPEFRVEWMEE